MSIYSDIALDLGLTGKYWPAVVAAFAAISKPSRLKLYDYIVLQITSVKLSLRAASSVLDKYDYLSQYIEQAQFAITTILLPVDELLRTMPIDQAIFEVPEIADIFREVVEFVPVTIPAAISETLPGTLGTDILEGVSSYNDLRYKLDEFLFRSARITSLRSAADTTIYKFNNQIDKFNNYLDIIVDLNYRGL